MVGPCMSIGAGFGPSSGMSRAVCESSEARLAYLRARRPELIGVLFVAASIGLLLGLNLIHEGRELLGGVVLAATATMIVVSTLVVIMASR